MPTNSTTCDAPGCATCKARGHTLFSILEQQDLAVVSSRKACRTHLRGKPIYLAGERPTGLYCIHQGRVKVYMLGRDGRRQIIRIVGPGDMLGYHSLIGNEPYSTCAEPIEHSQICHIPKDTFFELLSSSRDLSSRLMQLLSKELKVAEEGILSLSQRTVGERVAETLLILSRTHGFKSDQLTIDINLTRIELASMIGSSMESVSRQLSKLKREGVIDLAGRSIKVLDGKALLRGANLDD